jgi:HD-like signal output (HDOD) protein
MSILTRLHEIKELPTLPEVALRIQAMVGSEHTDAAMLAHIIERDPSLTSRILRVANSLAYGCRNTRVTSVKHAVTRLGFNEVCDISTAMSVIRRFPAATNLLDYQEFWRHSLAAAFLARLCAEHSSLPFSEADKQIMFLAGLLHDMGILALDQFFHDIMTEIFEHMAHNHLAYCRAETARLGKEGHFAVGGGLLELWKMAPALIAAVRCHHSPEKAPESARGVANITALAEYFLCNGRLGSFEGSMDLDCGRLFADAGVPMHIEAELFGLAEREVWHSSAILGIGGSRINELAAI